MIPWFIVTLVGWVVEPFGYQVYVSATSNNWFGADRLHVIFNPVAKRVPKLKARRMR